MSGKVEDGDVILITSQANNQDGSQTFYILDPCPSLEECSDDPPDIELVNLTAAKVKNTGAIALLSTNSNTGALEITLTKKADTLNTEEMDSEVNSQFNGSSSVNSSQEFKYDMISDNDHEEFVIKDEDEDVDVEGLGQNDNQGTEQRSEQDPTTLDEENLQQDDDMDEGILYIDDAKYSELQEELAHENVEELQKFKDIVMKETEIAISGTKSSQKEVDPLLDIKETHNKDGPSIEDACSQASLSHSIKKSSSNGSTLHQAFVHGQLIEIPTENQSENTAEKEFVDSTNTALTLLELAGGKSLRKNLDIGSLEMEIIKEIKNDKQFTSINDSQQTNELTTLTPLKCAAPNTSDNIEQPSTVKTKPLTSSTPRLKVSNEMVHRLLYDTNHEVKTSKPQYKHLLASSIVTRDEITKELMERSKLNNSFSESSGGDVFFAMKLARRLATKIVPTDKAKGDRHSAEKSELLSSDCTMTVTSNVQNNTPSSKGDEDSLILKSSSKIQPKKGNVFSDKELLKILEDDPDDPEYEESKLLMEPRPKILQKCKLRSSPLIKLHPELEKELALKQLQDVSCVTPRKKKISFLPEVLNKMPSQEKDLLKQHQEHNNNLNIKESSNQSNLAKRRVSDTSVRHVKKVKKVTGDSEVVTADPSHITETLTVEGQDLTGEQTKDGKLLKQYSNKRLSRNSETPPREVPLEILLNGVDDDVLPEDGANLSKNKIFTATNPKKRQEELQRKRQKHFANVLQRNKPHKKRGRPPKKRPIIPNDDLLNEKFLVRARSKQNPLEKVVDNNHADIPASDKEIDSCPKDEKPQKTKKMREIERLLGDEGAINMLYSVEQKRTRGSETKRSILPSYRRKKKDLILKTKLVKSAVLRLTTSPQAAGRVSLRGQATKEEENEDKTNETHLRKMSVDSHDSHHSLLSPPSEIFPFPAKIVPAEASRIIRRHSSSSNYSSRSNSPRRLSVDGERSKVMSPEPNSEIGQGEASLASGSKSVAKSCHQTPAANGVKKQTENRDRLAQEQSLSKQQQTSSDIKNTPVRTPTINKNKVRVHFQKEPKRESGRVKKALPVGAVKKITELNTSLAAAIDEFTKDTKSAKNIPLEKTRKSDSPGTGVNKLTRRSSPKVAVYRKSRASSAHDRRTKSSVIYNELTMKRYDFLVEIVLAPVSTKLKNAFNTNVLRELTTVLTGLAKDENCRAVLITSSGDVFCQGVDFIALIQPTAEQRMSAALEMAVAVKDFIKMLAMFAKPVVAGVQGSAVGLGTTMLPLCDLVFASDKATFQTPYAKLGQIPEGAATLTLPTLLGSSATSELLFASRKLTATEALHFGLVTRVLWTENFHDELMPIVTAIASQSSQSMDATKALLRHNLLAGLESSLVSETHLLIQHWTGLECQANFNRYLQQPDEGNMAFTLQPPQPQEVEPK